MKLPKKKLCSVCGKQFQPMQITSVCSWICALKFNEKKEVEKRLKKMKSDIQSVSDLEKIAKTIFQKWVRQRDAKLPCISCGKEYSPQFDGGHYFSAEQYSGLIFHEMNVNKQCCFCNRNLHGNQINYRKGLINKYGLEQIENLEAIAEVSRVYKYSKEELKEIARVYKLKLKDNC